MKHIIFFAALFIIIYPDFVYSDSLYLEGFYDVSSVTGGYPYTTDTSRYNDGTTSAAAYESTSPSFPQYTGLLANVTQRYIHYTDYMDSAAIQGIAGYGAGDEPREEAKLLILKKANFSSLPKPSKTFTVYASVKWNPSDFAIQEGETYNVTVFGSQSGYSNQYWYDGGIRVNSEGYSSYFDSISNCYVGMGRCRSHLKKKRRLLTANWMSLACAIGQFVRPIQEVQPGKESDYRWLPLDESTLIETIFDVGRTIVFRAVYTGQLICFANDAHTLYWNNKGSIQVTVTRESWPPKTDLVYHESLLPSCDSAQVVYVNHGNNTQNTKKTKVACNPNGGGSGWKYSDVINTEGGYGSGAPEIVYSDISQQMRNQ